MTITTRPMTASDEARWRALWQAYLTFYKEELADEITSTVWQKLLDPAQQPHGFVAENDNGDIVGLTHYIFHPTTWSLNDTVYLEDLFVDEAIRGSGAGRALIEAVAAIAKEKNCRAVYWKTNIQNERARKLYDKVALLSHFVTYEKSL